jgi:putative flippase GtrA
MNRLLASSPRYLAVSAGCMLFNIALLIGLDRLGVHYAIAVLVSASILIPLSYVLHVWVTYHAAAAEGSFARYVGDADPQPTRRVGAVLPDQRPG